MGTIQLIGGDFAKQLWAVDELACVMDFVDVDHWGSFPVEIVSRIIGRYIV